MGSRQADYMKLVDRCRALEPMGWKVDKKTDGFRITAANGETFMIHMTYSDYRAYRHHIVELENRGGLKQAENKLKGQRLKEARERHAADRQAAEEKALALAARNQGMVKKAAGPYLIEPDECDFEWLTTPHDRPWMRWMYIDVKTAAWLLENRNADNRRLSEDQALRYAKLILSNLWYLTHQGLAIDTRGMVQDAQHRLRGIVRAGDVNPTVKVPFPIFVGMPVENFKAIDEGRLRTAAQMLSKAGVPGGTAMVTIMRAVAAYDSENPRGYNRGNRFTQQQAWDTWEADPERWREAFNIGHRAHRASGKVLPLGQLAAAHYLITRTNGSDNVYVKAFFEGLIQQRKWRTNMVLPDDDPRNVLFDRYKVSRPTAPIEGVCWFIATWNNFVRGHHPMILRFTDRTEIPAVLKCVPGEGAAPRALAGELVGLDEHGNEIDEQIEEAA